MLQSIERYMKQAIVDKEPSVSSAALTSSLVCCLTPLTLHSSLHTPLTPLIDWVGLLVGRLAVRLLLTRCYWIMLINLLVLM